MKYAVVVVATEDQFIVGYDEEPTDKMIEELVEYYCEELHLTIIDTKKYRLTEI